MSKGCTIQTIHFQHSLVCARVAQTLSAVALLWGFVEKRLHHSKDRVAQCSNPISGGLVVGDRGVEVACSCCSTGKTALNPGILLIIGKDDGS